MFCCCLLAQQSDVFPALLGLVARCLRYTPARRIRSTSRTVDKTELLGKKKVSQ